MLIQTKIYAIAPMRSFCTHFKNSKIKKTLIFAMNDSPHALEHLSSNHPFFLECGEILSAALRKCAIYREISVNSLAALIIDACDKEIARLLWTERKKLSFAAVRLKLAGKTFIKCQGRLFRPPFDVVVESQYGVQTMQLPIIQSAGTDGDLLKRILDCGKSAALVDAKSNLLLICSKEIEQTSGRPWFSMVSDEGRNMNAMWPPDSLSELSRDLYQNGSLTDRIYDAYIWVEEESESGIVWVRAQKRFKASLFELVEFGSRICRLSMGVEII